MIANPAILDAVIATMFNADNKAVAGAAAGVRIAAEHSADPDPRGAVKGEAAKPEAGKPDAGKPEAAKSEAMSLAEIIDGALASAAPEHADATLGHDAIPRLMARMECFAALIDGRDTSFLVFEDMSALAIDRKRGLDHHRPFRLANHGFDADLRCAIRNIDHPDCVVKAIAPFSDQNPVMSATMQLRHALYNMADEYHDPHMLPKDYQHEKNWTGPDLEKMQAVIEATISGIDFPQRAQINITARWLGAPAKLTISDNNIFLSEDKDVIMLESMIAEMVGIDAFVGCNTEYNGGDYKRKSGYTTSAKNIVSMYVDTTHMTAHEKIAARKKLDGIAIAKFGDRSRAAAMATLAAAIKKKLA